MTDADDIVREGYLPTPDGWIWYEARGAQRAATPLLVLHGGPGAGYRSLEPLGALAADRCVVFYDQLGCGRSEEPDDPALWRIERFVDEIARVRELLGLDEIHLFGHSWGGWLAIEYMLTRPAGVASLILASTSASLPEYRREIERLRRALPPPIYQTIRDREAAGDLDDPDYKAAVLEFYQRHLCRLNPWPPLLIDNVHGLSGHAVYETMQGPNEFVITGNLKDWDRTARLGEIAQPALITAGRYDEATPACAETLRRGIPQAQLAIFEQSAHVPHLEEPQSYLAALKTFLGEVDRQRRQPPAHPADPARRAAPPASSNSTPLH